MVFYDAIIIGAGFSGIYQFIILLEKEHHIKNIKIVKNLCCNSTNDFDKRSNIKTLMIES